MEENSCIACLPVSPLLPQHHMETGTGISAAAFYTSLLLEVVLYWFRVIAFLL